MMDAILGGQRIIATVAFDDPAQAVPTAEALAAGGIGVVEVLFRTDVALQSLERITASGLDVVVGAGTILDRKSMERAVAAGASFTVSPGFDGELAACARELNVPFLPGAVTASEVQACLAHGLRTLKFFPANGAIGTIKSLAAVYGHVGVEFVPTGGVTNANLAEFLEAPAIRAVGMSWIAPNSLIRSGEYDAIAQRAQIISGISR